MLHVALLGCGNMGRRHLKSYRQLTDAVCVAAVCDLDKKRSLSGARPFGARAFTDFGEMMADGGFDAVDICLPTYLHKEYGLWAMKEKKHVFSEKPIALSAEDAQELLDAAERAGVSFSVGHVARYFPAYSRAAQVIASGRIGTPKLVRATRTGSFPRWGWQNWYADYRKSGGPILDLAIHDFDWLLQILGNVRRVYAQSYGGCEGNQDHCLATLRFESGAIAHVEASWAYPQETEFGTTFEVVGTAGQIEYDSRASAPIRRLVNDGTFSRLSSTPLPGETDPYTTELREFYASIKNRTLPPVSGDQALKALCLARAAMDSAREGQPYEQIEGVWRKL